jgi:hypothetical protein
MLAASDWIACSLKVSCLMWESCPGSVLLAGVQLTRGTGGGGKGSSGDGRRLGRMSMAFEET